MSKEIIFSVPLYKYKVKDWDVKKKKLLDLFNSFKHKVVGNVITSPIISKTNILDEEIKLFEKEINLKFRIDDIWFQKYEEDMNHEAHNHGAYGFSSVCFIEYDKNYHKPTVFLSPFDDNIFGVLNKYHPIVEEGDIIFFPSNLLHYAPINTSKKERIIISFNLSIDLENNRKKIIRYQ